MKRKQHKALAAYVRDTANRLALRDWTVALNVGPLREADHNGQVECVYGRRYAVVTVPPDFDRQPRETQRHTVVHELVHCHLDPLRLVVENLETNLGDALYGVTMGTHRDATEYATDALADAFSPLIPLPPEVG